MKKNCVGMGVNYFSEKFGRVKTVAKATDSATGNPVIMYVNIGSGGIASEPIIMNEQEFIDKFL